MNFEHLEDLYSDCIEVSVVNSPVMFLVACKFMGFNYKYIFDYGECYLILDKYWNTERAATLQESILGDLMKLKV